MSMTNEELVKLIKSGKQEYSEQLYKQNKGIILKHAKRYSRYADIDDLIQESAVLREQATEALENAKEKLEECIRHLIEDEQFQKENYLHAIEITERNHSLSSSTHIFSQVVEEAIAQYANRKQF